MAMETAVRRMGTPLVITETLAIQRRAFYEPRVFRGMNAVTRQQRRGFHADRRQAPSR
jgi:hypothetical protein